MKAIASDARGSMRSSRDEPPSDPLLNGWGPYRDSRQAPKKIEGEENPVSSTPSKELGFIAKVYDR